MSEHVNIGEVFSTFDRNTIASAVEVLVAVLDAMDGDLDVEPNGDELDGSLAEDDFMDHNYSFRAEPGCPISDPDAAVDDQGCDDINDDREEEVSMVADYGIDQTAGMLPFNPGVDRAMLRAHRDHIRATRCDSKRTTWGDKRYSLSEERVTPTKRQMLKRKRGAPKRPRP